MRRAHGSFGSRNGKAWDQGFSDRLRTQASNPGVSASPADTPLPPSQRAMQDAIAAQTCPFCGAGPFKSLGLHTNKAHGVGAAELRAMSGLDHVCSPNLSRESRARLERRPDREEISKKGTQAAVAKGAHLVAAAASAAQRRAEAAVRDPEIIALANAQVPRAEIARLIGVSPESVRRILDRHGVAMPMEVTNAERRVRLAANQGAARRSQDAKQGREKQRRLARFVELGGDWTAMKSLAAECNTTAKSMTEYLRKAGVVLGDGRRA